MKTFDKLQQRILNDLGIHVEDLRRNQPSSKLESVSWKQNGGASWPSWKQKE